MLTLKYSLRPKMNTLLSVNTSENASNIHLGTSPSGIISNGNNLLQTSFNGSVSQSLQSVHIFERFGL